MKKNPTMMEALAFTGGPVHKNIDEIAYNMASGLVLMASNDMVHRAQKEGYCITCLMRRVIFHFTTIGVSMTCGADHEMLHNFIDSIERNDGKLRREALRQLNDKIQFAETVDKEQADEQT